MEEVSRIFRLGNIYVSVQSKEKVMVQLTCAMYVGGAIVIDPIGHFNIFIHNIGRSIAEHYGLHLSIYGAF